MKRITNRMSKLHVRNVILVVLMICSVVFPAVLFGRIHRSKVLGFQSRTALMLGCEMMCEIGPNFKVAAKQHRFVLDEYFKYNPSSYIVTKISPKHELRKNLEVWSAYLKTFDSNEITQEKAAQAIWKAGEEIVRFRMRTAGLSANEDVLPKKKMSPSLKDKIDAAMAECNKTLKALINDNNSATALKLCEADRLAMILLFYGRSDSNISDYLKEFRTILEDANDFKNSMVKNKDINDEKELLKLFIDSNNRRLKIVDAMLEPDMSKACTLLWSAISQSAAERPKKLQLASKLNYGEIMGMSTHHISY